MGAHSRNSPRPALLGMVAAWLGLLVWSVPSVALADPSVTVSPDKGRQGAEVTVNGRGFEPNAPITILWDDSILKEAITTGESGEFSARITVPAADPGPHRVVASSVLETAAARFILQGGGTDTTTTTAPTTTTTTTAPTTTTTTTPTTTTAPTTTTTTTAPTTTAPTTTAPTTSTAPSTTGTPTTAEAEAETTDSTSSPGDGEETPPTTSAEEDGADESAAPAAPTDTTAVDTPDSTTSTTDTTASSGPEVTTPMVLPPRAGAPGNGARNHEMAGAVVTVGRFSLAPARAFAGTTLDMTLVFEEMIPGLSSVQIMMGDERLGEPVPANSSQMSVRRTVPDLPAGTYEVVVVSGDLVLARADFVLAESQAASSGGALGPGLLALAAMGLGWQMVRMLQGSPGSALWLESYDGWRTWMDSRRRS